MRERPFRVATLLLFAVVAALLVPAGAAHAQPPSGQLFAIGNLNGHLYSVDPNGTGTIVGDPPSAFVVPNPSGLVYNTALPLKAFYSISEYSGELYGVDPSNGAGDQIGTAKTSDGNLTGLAFGNGTLYAIGGDTGNLYSVNATTGLGTRVGSGTTATHPRSLSFGGGFLWTLNSNPGSLGQLYKIDPATGQGTTVGTGHFPHGTIPNGSVYDPTLNMLWVNTEDGQLWEVSPVDGTAAHVGTGVTDPAATPGGMALVLPVLRTVSVNKVGSGAGTVTFTAPPSCVPQPAQCTVTDGMSVSVSATVGAGSTFTKWVAGPCLGGTTNPCVFTATSDVTVTAAFTPVPVPSGRLYAIGNLGGHIYSVDANGTGTQVGTDAFVTPNPSGLTFDPATTPPATFFTITEYNHELWTVDATSGFSNQVGSGTTPANNLTGLVWANGTLYAIDSDGGGLYNVSPTTGTGTRVGTGTTPGLPTSLAFDGTSLWTLSNVPANNGQLYRVNISTGEGTPVGSGALPHGVMPGGSVYDPVLHTLWVNSQSNGGLYQVDPATGIGQRVGTGTTDESVSPGGMALVAGTPLARTVTIGVTGTGTVAFTAPLACVGLASCTTLHDGDSVTVSATPGASQTFTGWTAGPPACNAKTTNPCVFNVSGDATLTAAFAATTNANTATTVGSSANPSTYHQPVTLTATVVTVPAGATPTGTVTFSDLLPGGSVPICTNVALSGGGTAACITSTLTAGSHEILAAYTPTGLFNPSTRSITQNVNRAATTTSVGFSPNPAAFGQPVTLNATVTSAAGIPAGTVEFAELLPGGSTPICSAPLDTAGKAACVTSNLSAGVHAITATYTGDTDGNFDTSSATLELQTVSAAGTTTSLVSSRNPAPPNTAITFVASVTAPDGGPPTGSVMFFSGVVPLGTVTLANGAASLTTDTLAAGTYQITAAYQGDANHSASTSPTVTQVVVAPPTGLGYWLVASDGGIFTEGGAVFFGSTGGIPLNKPIVGMAPTPSGKGYWLVASDGGIFTEGDAKFWGSTGGMALNKPIVGMAPTPTGLGYWLVASDGGIFSEGDAKFAGSTGNIRLNQPIVGMAATPSGKGYWLVASDGGIFAEGDAVFRGSTGDVKLNKPIVGMAATPTGLGYWLVASDGGIFTFPQGDAQFFGSLGGTPLNQPIVGMASTPSGKGYWLVASDGGIFAEGDAPFLGSTGNVRLNKPIVGMAVTPGH